MRKPTTVATLTEPGRVRLSPSVFIATGGIRNRASARAARRARRSGAGSGRQVMARRIDDNLPNSAAGFYPTSWALNIPWHERPQRRIDSHAAPKGRWVR
ncbi:MAG TPA: hypothetical protein VN240_10215 [Propylenella sp.]|nr:hypothetical protein [Propylenella sp.]